MRDVCMHKWLEMVLDGIIIQGASKMGLPMVSLIYLILFDIDTTSYLIQGNMAYELFRDQLHGLLLV